LSYRFVRVCSYGQAHLNRGQNFGYYRLFFSFSSCEIHLPNK